MTTPMISHTDFAASEQAGQILRFTQNREASIAPALFTDNLDHIQALEDEAKLMLAVAVLRRGLNNGRGKDDRAENFGNIFPFLPENITLKEAEGLLEQTSRENRRREEASLRNEVALNFLSFCELWKFDPFERKVVMMLFLQNTAPDFIGCFRNSGFEVNFDYGMKIGTLLAIIAPDLRQQLAYRRYFSINNTFFREQVLAYYSDIDSFSTILQLYVYLHERNVRYILGDNNLYHSPFNFISMERSSVELAQVVLPEKLKEDVVSCVERFMTGRKNGALERLDNFFGYGTGLPILFHGPSGTGKTMLANGLAHRLDVPLLTLNLQEMEENHFDYSFILSFLFKEATLMGAIVFLDECDDIFCGENNARLSRALLLELEKSRCITILATNRPVELDPAMERRLVMKVHFTRPDAPLRLRMWQALTPSTLPLSKEIDLPTFAERYLFTGGLIKNTVFMAANAAIALGKNEITRELLEHAAGQQSLSLTDVNGLCRVYIPDRILDSLDLHNRQKEELRNTAIAWRRLHNEELRLNMLISTTHIDTGIKAAECLAASCGLKIRAFDYDKVISMSEENRVIDPVSQRKVTPMDYAFSAGSGDAAMILFVDHEGFMNRILDKKEEDGKGVLLSELTSRMRNHRGLFCMVAPKLNQSFPPVEFNLHFQLEYPPVETQIRQWERHLAGIPGDDDRLVELVEQYPMHTAEIDFIAGEAVTQSIIQGMDGKPSLKSVHEVIARYRRKSGAPLLFGKGR